MYLGYAGVCGWLYLLQPSLQHKYLAYKSCLSFIITVHNATTIHTWHTYDLNTPMVLDRNVAVCIGTHMTHSHTYLPSVAIHENRTLCRFQAKVPMITCIHGSSVLHWSYYKQNLIITVFVIEYDYIHKHMHIRWVFKALASLFTT